MAKHNYEFYSLEITKDNLNKIAEELEELANNQCGEITNIYCPECKEKTKFFASEVSCEDCGSHLAVSCDNCSEGYDSVFSRYDDIQKYNIERWQKQ